MSNLYDVLRSMISKIKETEGAIPKKVSQLEQDVTIDWDDIDGKPDFSGGGGVSGPVSWNDLTDRPFGEEIALGDTLTWDGNTDGLVSLADQQYLVSELTPTPDEMPNGVTSTMVKPSGEIVYRSMTPEEIETNYQSDFLILGEGLFVCYTDGFSIHGLTIPKAGIYFANFAEVGYVSSLTIPGYGKFETETIKTIDPKYLPDSVKLTVTTTEKFRIEYDGNPDGREKVETDEYVYLKVSDEYLEQEAWIGGTITATSSSGNAATIQVTEDLIETISTKEYAIASTFMVRESGVWVIFPLDMYETTKSHSVVFEGLQETTVTKIDPKFIPDSVLLESEMGKIVNAVINALPTAEGGSF